MHDSLAIQKAIAWLHLVVSFCKILFPQKKIKIKYDLSKPNGTPRKVLNVSLAKNYGWSSKIKLKDSIKETYKYFLLENKN